MPANMRGNRQPWRILTKGESTKLMSSASAIGTRISRPK